MPGNDALKQSKRVGSLETPLGQDKLALSRFEGTEGMSELFEFRVDALSKDADIDFNKALGLNCSVRSAYYRDPDRWFDGILVEAQALGMVHELYSYRLVLRPKLWLLSRTANCRIWHDKTALDIIKEVIQAQGVELRTATTRDTRKREYCVQYRETDLAFVSRLMEEEGISYFFEHKQGSHTMVLADSTSSHKDIPGHGSIRFSSASVGGHVREEAIFEWTSERRFRSGKFEFRDYNFKTSGDKLNVDSKASEKYTKSDMEVYDYPGKYDNKGEGKAYIDLRRDAEQAADHRRYGSGESPSLFPGSFVTMKEHPKGGENIKYLVVRATHQFSVQTYRSNGDVIGGDERYQGHYEFLPGDKVFRPPCVTPKPVVYGPQTARVVCGPNSGDSEEIFVDDHGRVRVRFHWDRDDKRSCWVRVAQVWAGAQWGGQFIPRVDMEVVVEFLEGDPDRPLVVGCVYNDKNKYPWSLPDNKTQSGIKSRSSKGGGASNYNQLRFEDKKGKEQIEIQGEKDLDVLIKDTQTWEIAKEFTSHKGPESRNTTLHNGDDKLDVKNGNQKVHISKDQTIDVDQGIYITAKKEIILKVGPSTLTMDNTGVTIKAPTITYQAQTTMDIKAGATMKLVGMMIMIN